ncbi:hypothetical protein KY348_04865 [Candidatus Woesearchaeota archaeon]|nr:hypothetical protein [Candidatus Woesearchaeota archaeon]
MRVNILIYLLLVILLSASVCAFGIGYQYMEDNTLELYPGQNYMFKLEVQNKDGPDTTVNVDVDSSIANLAGGPELRVPTGTFDRHVFINITVPEDAQPGDIYNINYLVSPVGRGEGQIPIGIRYDRNFKVKVVPRPEGAEEEKPALITGKPGFPKWVFIPIIIIILFALVVLIWKKSDLISEKIIKKKPESKITKPKHEPVTKPESGLPLVKPQFTHETHEPKKRPEEHPKEHPIEHSKEHHEEHQKPVEHQAHLVKKGKELSPDQYFHLKDGRKLRDLEDMYHVLQNMDEHTFNHHLTSTRNDFAAWAAHSLGEQELANKLFTKTTRQEMLELIKNELEKQ